MTPDTDIRPELRRAAGAINIDTDGSLGRFHGARPRRVIRRRIVTATTALAIAAAAFVFVWVALPSGGDRGMPATSGASGSNGVAGTVAYMVVSEDGAGATLASTDVQALTPSALPGGPFAVFPVFSPDGTKVAYGAGADYDHTELTVADADGSDPQGLGVEIRGPFSWSPDGSQIAYLRGDELPNGYDVAAVISAGGTDDRVILAGLAWQSVAWSPDGDRLLLVGHPAAESDTSGPDGWDVYSVGLDGTDLVQLTMTQEWEHLATWSPDGRSIVYTRSTESSDDADYPSDVWVMSADGSDPHALTDWRGFDAWPVWSPDGEWIAFASDRDATDEEQAAFRRGDAFAGVSIFVMRADGTDVRRIVTADQGQVLLPGSWRSPVAP